MRALWWSPAIGTCVVAVALSASIAAQAPTGRVAFEAVSVKPIALDAPRPPISTVGLRGNRWSASNVTLMTIIRAAYRGHQFSAPDQFVGGPDWIRTARFDVDAVAVGMPDQSTAEAMVRALLADRFKLVVREETRELAVGVLVRNSPERLGPGLRPVKVDCTTARKAPAAPPTSAADFATRAASQCETLQASTAVTRRYSGRAVDLSGLVRFISSAVEQPVSDRTGLAGQFDLDLEFLQPSLATGVTPPSLNGTPVEAPPLLEALKEQLGLKLERERAPTPVLVIERAEMPEPN
jgi:uncharacterized protein (TIGR03435 family)